MELPGNPHLGSFHVPTSGKNRDCFRRMSQRHSPQVPIPIFGTVAIQKAIFTISNDMYLKK